MTAATPTTSPLPTPDLVAEPFRDGFSRRAVIGAFFLAAVMVPAAIYLSLMLGGGLTAAADWVTVILFLELARRSFQKLSRQEIMVLIHIASSIGTATGAGGLAGGVFGSLVWQSYLRHSGATAQFGLANELPNWVAPAANVVAKRNLWQEAWLPAIGVLVISHLLGRVQSFTAGYLAFRLTADVERLKFPMAPVAAQGAMALAEHSGRSESWRWNAFAIGAAGGGMFAVLSTLVPAVTGALLNSAIFILPNPWYDLSTSTESFLPATAVVFTVDLGVLLVGMIIPWRVLIGTVLGTVVFQLILNPFVLQPMGILKSWRPGFSAINTAQANSLDFYLSETIGCAAAIAAAGIIALALALYRRRRKRLAAAAGDTSIDPDAAVTTPPQGRGDFNVPLMIAIFFACSLAYVWLCHVLVPSFPVWIFLAFGFLYTPLMTYITARMQGITGTHVGFPMVREGTFLMSGYERPDVWYAPIPLHDYGGGAQWFRQMELTRTKFTSMLKAEILIFPIMLVASFLFWSYMWGMDPIPSEKYPPAQIHWPAAAKMSALWSTAQSSGASYLTDALKMPIIFICGSLTLVALGGCSLLGISVEYVYGFIGGSQTGIVAILFPALIGALLSRYVLSKKFGREHWRSYIPVILAGYACGAGLIGMLGMAIVFLQRSVSSLPY